MTIRPALKIPPLVVEAVRIEDIRTVMDVMDDVNPVHVDEELVRRLGLPGLVNQGPANVGYCVNMLLQWAGDPAALRRLAFRFLSISSPGDRLTAAGLVETSRISDQGETIECAFWLEKDDGERVLDGTAELFLDAAAVPADRR